MKGKIILSIIVLILLVGGVYMFTSNDTFSITTGNKGCSINSEGICVVDIPSDIPESGESSSIG